MGSKDVFRVTFYRLINAVKFSDILVRLVFATSS